MLGKIFSPKINGFLLSNAFGMATIGISKLLMKDFNGTLIFSEFVIVPFLMGIVSAWFWRNINFGSRQLAAWACYNTLIAILLSAIILKEGVICLIIVSPLLMAFIIMGSSVGYKMFKKNNQTLNVSVFVMLFGIFIFDSLSVHHYENKVADTMVINAPPAEVWKYVVAYKRIETPGKYWLFRIGMPSPVQSTAEGYYLGAKR